MHSNAGRTFLQLLVATIIVNTRSRDGVRDNDLGIGIKQVRQYCVYIYFSCTT